MMGKDLRQRSGLAWFCARAESCVIFNTGPYTVLPDNSILITANMQSVTGFPSSHQLNFYVASKSRLKLAARCPVSGCWPSCWPSLCVARCSAVLWVHGICCYVDSAWLRLVQRRVSLLQTTVAHVLHSVCCVCVCVCVHTITVKRPLT